MPEKNRLQEEFEKLQRKEEKRKTEEKLQKVKDDYLKLRVKKILNDVLYVLIISLLFGLCLFAWMPERFSILRALSLGVIWYLLFEEIKLQNIFRR